MKPQKPWTVGAHSPIQKIDDNLWVVTDVMKGNPIHRRMSIVKRTDGHLLFYGAIPLTDAELDEIRAWGTPAYLVVGHDYHMVDGPAFREKLGLKLYGPASRAAQIALRTTFDGGLEDIPKDAAVSIEAVPGSRFNEPMAIVRSGSGARVSLLFCDAIDNNPRAGSPLLMRLLGFTGEGPKVVFAFRLLFMTDRAALKSALLRWSDIPNLSRIVPFHGVILEQGAREAMRRAANEL